MTKDLRLFEVKREKELQPDGTWRKPQGPAVKRMSSKQAKEFKKEVNMKKCRYCHSTENLTLDHKVPLSKGGKNEKSNLQCLCEECNSMKSNLTHAEVKRLFDWHIRVVLSRAENDKIARAKKRKQKTL